MDDATEEYYLKQVGANIMRLRKDREISRLQLAFELNTNEKQLRLIEAGKINTGILSLYKIAAILDVKPKDLLDFEC